MTNFSATYSNFVYSFIPFPYLIVLFFFYAEISTHFFLKEFEDRQFELQTLMKFIWFLILTIVFN